MKGDGAIRITPQDILIVAFVDQVAITMSQQGLSILSVDFKNYAHLGVAQMGILFSTVALGAILGMIPAGAALDRLGSKRVAWISGVAIFVVMGILAFWLPTHFVPLMALLGLVGCFLPALSLTGATAITKVFDGSSYEGMAIGLRQAATPLGGIIAASLFPLLVKTWTLKTVLFVIALNVGGWTILFGSVLHNSSLSGQKPSTSYDWRRLWRLIKELTRPLIVSSLLSPGQYALLTYAILDLHDRWHIHLTYAGPVIALALFGGFVVRIFMGHLTDRGVQVTVLIRLTALVGVVSLAIWALLPKGTPFVVLLPTFLGLGAGLDGWNALITAWVANVTTERERGMALGLIGMSGFVGIVLFLPVFGLMIRVLHSYRPAWGLLAVIYVGGMLMSRPSRSHTAQRG
ncbi:MFS transporter [Sulfobacillus thermosulfidooxidans]|uniref:MFS transporter n=1 Tax=Sulfobacillus thermosulfidooxidans TaxID=28034 RepID=UPI000415AFC2|nr:MFS transporter [Sulfobacillus thermosulfidooxidans]